MRSVFNRLWLSVFCLAVVVVAQPVQARVVGGNTIMDQPMRENLCALTFDDGPSINTPHLLDMLEEYGIPSTFFFLGN